MIAQQLPLFPGEPPTAPAVPPRPSRSELTADSPLTAAVERFRDHMVQQGYAENTVKSFLGDLRIFKRYLEANPAVGRISTHDLERFLHWLQHERGTPCSPKSYARRLTTLKVFFSWLVEARVLPFDPAAPVAHRPVSTPLPHILYDAQIDQVLAVTHDLMAADEPDPRPHLLVTLVLHTGIKKQECMGIKLAHIDASNPAEPAVHIRYSNPRMQHKERRLRLPPGWIQTLARYRQAYEPKDVLFPWTARNLEYVLADVAKRAGLPEGLSFEMLRWTCSVRDHQARMDPERLRRKLGLSMMSWRETEPKIIRLAEPPL